MATLTPPTAQANLLNRKEHEARGHTVPQEQKSTPAACGLGSAPNHGAAAGTGGNSTHPQNPMLSGMRGMPPQNSMNPAQENVMPAVAQVDHEGARDATQELRLTQQPTPGATPTNTATMTPL